jgi:hypothetical protein
MVWIRIGLDGVLFRIDKNFCDDIKAETLFNTGYCFCSIRDPKAAVIGLYFLYIQGYYKRNRHFQCCIKTKLLMI